MVPTEYGIRFRSSVVPTENISLFKMTLGTNVLPFHVGVNALLYIPYSRMSSKSFISSNDPKPICPLVKVLSITVMCGACMSSK